MTDPITPPDDDEDETPDEEVADDFQPGDPATDDVEDIGSIVEDTRTPEDV